MTFGTGSGIEAPSETSQHAGRTLPIPQLCLVVLVGVSGSGKSTFAARHFGRYEVISSDTCRGLVADDENDQDATKDAFEVLEYVVGKRLARGRLTVVDATNTQREARRRFIDLAREHDVLPVAIVLDLPERVCVDRTLARTDRDFGADVVRRQRDHLRRSLRHLDREGFRRVHVLRTVEEVDTAQISRERLLNDRRDVAGPFDVIGDVHGCSIELFTLLTELGYDIVLDDQGQAVDAVHPDGRTVVFVGDLVDRGPDSPGVLRLAMGMTRAGHAFAVPGNHENKLVRALDGRAVQVSHGLAQTLAQLEREPETFRTEVRQWAYDLVSHLVFDEGRLVVAHAGLPERYHGRASGRVRSFALYGDTTGETDEFGLPVRHPWAQDYRGAATVLYGHVPTTEAVWVNNTMCLDTGCVFGGALTALRYPEKEIVQVPALREWFEPIRPLSTPDDTTPTGEDRPEGELDIEDVLGARAVQTGHHGRISIRAEQAAGALEVMSRFALAPRWVPYLPPTMAPVASAAEPDVLEHPREAFATYADVGVDEVICEEKHMGSRAVVHLVRGGTGACYSRTGRSLLPPALTAQLLGRIDTALDVSGIWDELNAGQLVLDGELMPWSVKADPLIREQFAAVGAAARACLPVALGALEAAMERGLDVADLRRRTTLRRDNAEAFAAAYRPHVWDVDGLDGLRYAPFQLLATRPAGDSGGPAAGSVGASGPGAERGPGGTTYTDRNHAWHLALADRLVEADPELFTTTQRLVVDTRSEESIATGIAWWEHLTATGGEGMVVKPLDNLVQARRGRRGLVQPGLKVRGREYLRLVYGPDYTLPEHLTRLKERQLGTKRSLALREYALGVEALERYAAGQPLWRVHEAVFAVLALESEPVDPRL